MRRLLRFGCLSGIVVLLIVAAAAVLSSRGAPPRDGSAPPAALTIDYLRPDQRSGPYAGFVVEFRNATNEDIANPQTRVAVDLGGQRWSCQGFGDPMSGEPRTSVGDVLGAPLIVPAGASMTVTVYCRMPAAPLADARVSLR